MNRLTRICELIGIWLTAMVVLYHVVSPIKSDTWQMIITCLLTIIYFVILVGHLNRDVG